MEEDPGTGTAYISSDFMEKLQVTDGEAVEIVDYGGFVVQARSHPNPWVDTRMISIDKNTVEKTGLQLFGQVKLRKTSCTDSESVTLEVPDGVNVTRMQLQSMLDRADGAIISGQDHINLKTNRGMEVRFGIKACEPPDISRISHCTRIELVDTEGRDYVSRKDTTFDDVGGLDEAIKKVREVVQLPLRHPEVFFQLGIDPPRGVLLHGPSGTGKTLIARAVAGETGCWFKGIIGTEIMDKHYGESEAKLRAAFEEAYDHAPAIIFIDEVDALAPRRDTADGDVERRVTAQLLAIMDGMEDRGQVIVLAATNMPNVLDPALRRPGRFDREILIGVPDQNGRKKILEIHTRDMPLGSVDLNDLADRTHGFVGADVKALCREASYKALRRMLPGLEDTDQKLSDDFLDALRIENQDFEEALKEMSPSSGRNFEVNLKGAGWDRIAGYGASMEFLKEMVLWPLQNVKYLSNIGVGHLEGLLLTGPPGVGKTLMARSLAKESRFNVIEIRGPELISKYMGDSERNVRELFRQAREMAPTVVILDGADAMTSSGVSGGEGSRLIDRVANQLVQEMNVIDSESPVLVVAICHRADDLPPSLRATGRFGTELSLKLPDSSDRAALYTMYLNRDRISFQGDLVVLARDSDGLSAGDIKEVCSRAVLQAARHSIDRASSGSTELSLSEDDVLKALDRWKLTANVTNSR
jgi:transitional endoplasmic reticulum ATPase